MKWLTGIVIAIIIVALGWYLLDGAGIATPSIATSTGATSGVQIIPGTPNQTYSNMLLGFSMQYPASASTSADFSTGFLPLTQSPVVAFTLPSSMFSGTNLVEAGVYVGATSSDSVVTNCAEPLQGEIATTSVVIGGDSFAVFTSSDAGAGNFYQEKAYRTLQAGECIEIVELLHSGNIGNYPSGSVTQFDEDAFSGILERIVQSFEANS